MGCVIIVHFCVSPAVVDTLASARDTSVDAKDYVKDSLIGAKDYTVDAAGRARDRVEDARSSIVDKGHGKEIILSAFFLSCSWPPIPFLDAKEYIKDTAEGAKDSIKEKAGSAKDTIKESAEESKDYVKEKGSNVSDRGRGIKHLASLSGLFQWTRLIVF